MHLWCLVVVLHLPTAVWTAGACMMSVFHHSACKYQLTCHQVLVLCWVLALWQFWWPHPVWGRNLAQTEWIEGVLCPVLLQWWFLACSAANRSVSAIFSSSLTSLQGWMHPPCSGVVMCFVSMDHTWTWLFHRSCHWKVDFDLQKECFLEVELGCQRLAWCTVALAQRRSYTDWSLPSHQSWCLGLTFLKVFRAAKLTVSLKTFQCSVILSGGFSTSLPRAVSIQDLKASAYSWCFNLMVFSFSGGLAVFSLYGGLMDRQDCDNTIWWSVEHSALHFTLVIWISEMSLCWVMT